MANLAGAITGSGRSIGRYFGTISVLPSLILVVYVYWLVSAGAWSGRFEPVKGLEAAGHLNVEQVAALLAATFIIGLALHPFQFAMTQLLEGYWGISSIGLHLAKKRILHYRSEAQRLDEIAEAARYGWIDDVQQARASSAGFVNETDSDRMKLNLLYLDAECGDPMVGDYLRSEVAEIARDRYPAAGRRIMPTRLGNALRRYEDEAGRQYGLNILRIAPHLNLVAAKEHRDYLDDTRKGLDLNVRLCFTAAIAVALSIPLLAGDGAWLLLSLVPYCASYFAYRGAVSSAHEYGTALSTVVDLNRFALYEQLGLSRPRNTRLERQRNAKLMSLLSGNPDSYLPYKHGSSNGKVL
jgi:hypothetical protein